MLVASSSAFIDGIERFARADEMPRVLLRPTADTDFNQVCGAEVRARLTPFTGSSRGREKLELGKSAPNPARVRRWLETSTPHISLLFSPLTERGPPTR